MHAYSLLVQINVMYHFALLMPSLNHNPCISSGTHHCLRNTIKLDFMVNFLHEK